MSFSGSISSEEDDDSFSPEEVSEDDDLSFDTEIKEEDPVEPAMSRPSRKKSSLSLDETFENLNVVDEEVREKLMHPICVYTHKDQSGTDILSVEIVCFSGTLPKQYKLTVSEDGRSLKVEYSFPDIFLENAWLNQIDASYNAQSTKFQARKTAIDSLKAKFKHRPVIGLHKEKLPFPVEQNPTRRMITLHNHSNRNFPIAPVEILCVEYTALKKVMQDDGDVDAYKVVSPTGVAAAPTSNGATSHTASSGMNKRRASDVNEPTQMVSDD